MTRARGIALSFIALLLGATSAPASPALSVNWSGCPASHPPVNRNLSEGPISSIVISGHGFTRPVRAVQAWLMVGRTGYTGIPDAWRFDPAGCQAGRFQASYAAASSDCPALVGDHVTQVSRFDYNGDAGKGVAIFAAAFDLRETDPNATYTIVRFQFDHSNGFFGLGAKPDSCGCVERPQCLRIVTASWLDENLVEYPFVIEQEFATWQDPTNSSFCPGVVECFDPPCDIPDPCAAPQPTPAHTRSWGSVKSWYR